MSTRPFDDGLLRNLVQEHGTPLYVQGVDELPERVRSLGAFDVVRYAMKANPGLVFLQAVRRAGAWVDCVSAGELAAAKAAGFEPSEMCFTADLFDRTALDGISDLRCAVNLGSEDMIEQYAKLGVGKEVTLRINPGFGSGHDHRVNTGGPASKHGIWHTNLPRAIERANAAGLTVSGLHMHIGSGADMEHLLRVTGAMRDAARVVGASLRMISAGGGLPVSYRDGDPELDLDAYSRAWTDLRDELAAELGHPLELEVEPGRYLAAKPALIVTEVRAIKDVDGMPFVLVDAGFNTLCRPAIYGAYHEISILGRDGEPTRPTMVAGPLCESGDVFTQGPGGKPDPRELPVCEVRDLLCLHDTGAYGASMASNFNSMPVAAEVVVENGKAQLGRRSQWYFR